MPTLAQHIAIPPPMSPAPTIPTQVIVVVVVVVCIAVVLFARAALVLALVLALVRGMIFGAARTAKKKWRSAALSTEASSFLNSIRSYFAPSVKEREGSHAASTQRMIARGALSPRRFRASFLCHFVKSTPSAEGAGSAETRGFDGAPESASCESFLGANEPRQPLRALAAREETDIHFWKAKARCCDRDSVMAHE